MQRGNHGVREYAAYCFDLDGTVYVGDEPVPGAKRTIDELRRQGKKIRFLTNSSVHTRLDCKRRLQRLGVDCEEEEVLTALHLSGQYFREQAPQASVFLVGEEAMRAQMELSGVAVARAPEHATHVLVGMDRALTYEKLRLGMLAVRAGARLIAVNPDPVCPVPRGWIPDTWTMVRALETASGAVAELVIGKPSRYYANQALRGLGLPPEQCLMVGDRLETDIALGTQSGMATALVLTGVTALAELAHSGLRPTYVLRDMTELVGHF
ncbi:HAD-IIA family hydrolase [Paenibacillus sp. IB182496]|uniref:HAD-IIA family hydrolase n=1 Tax=Paenibacillus sabuli TaxID=2772509 RepID=A0A927BX40_9BACL|nr:HAD-IIA family hydrolase [Paenibacillus sabuli]MBD2847044.1 HAD-IIA family hydrolase [Paenibacillus sabuli]